MQSLENVLAVAPTLVVHARSSLEPTGVPSEFDEFLALLGARKPTMYSKLCRARMPVAVTFAQFAQLAGKIHLHAVAGAHVNDSCKPVRST